MVYFEKPMRIWQVFFRQKLFRKLSGKHNIEHVEPPQVQCRMFSGCRQKLLFLKGDEMSYVANLALKK